MKEFIEKLIGRLERNAFPLTYNFRTEKYLKFDKAIEIVNELAEEYKDKTNIIDGLKAFLKDKFDYCAEQAEMNLEAECNSEIPSYFRNRKELYLDRANIYGEVMREIDRLAEEYKGGWIPCSERLPDEGQTVLVQDFEDYYEVYNCETKQGVKGFSSGDWWASANNYIAWMPIPAPYKENENDKV